ASRSRNGWLPWYYATQGCGDDGGLPPLAASSHQPRQHCVYCGSLPVARTTISQDMRWTMFGRKPSRDCTSCGNSESTTFHTRCWSSSKCHMCTSHLRLEVVTDDLKYAS
ncbi:hypothetical protein GOODEAATRI_032300, partial [Goodea atripinnis]